MQLPADCRVLVVCWFRKALRLHDNQALNAALEQCRGAATGDASNSASATSRAAALVPLFCLDPRFRPPAVVAGGAAVNAAQDERDRMRVGRRRWLHLQQTLTDVDTGLRALKSRLFVVPGDPVAEVLPALLHGCRAANLRLIVCYERDDVEPYGKARDAAVRAWAARHPDSVVTVLETGGHTLYDPADVCRRNGGAPSLRYQSFLDLVRQTRIEEPLPAPESIEAYCPSTAQLKHLLQSKISGAHSLEFSVPTADGIVPDSAAQHSGDADLPGPPEDQVPQHPGGETEALRRMEAFLADAKRVVTFAKPQTDPATWRYPEQYSTTVLSPYLKFGSLSVRVFYHRLRQVDKEYRHGGAKGGGGKQQITAPPVSLLGQVYWREFYYCAAYGTENYHRMHVNPICLQTEWRCRDSWHDAQDPLAEQHLVAWANARTGFPWIDAIMTQLRREGWIHHLARHCVACFLTRGDLYISWERGAEVFDELLLDADYSLNNGNWMWLSASAFFHQYFRVYSPIAFGQKYDKEGAYIRHFVPQLKDMPAKFIYEPWKAPIEVQRKAKCIIGRDYPRPIVDHGEASRQCMAKMKAAYAERRNEEQESGEQPGGNNGDEAASKSPKKRRLRK